MSVLNEAKELLDSEIGAEQVDDAVTELFHDDEDAHIITVLGKEKYLEFVRDKSSSVVEIGDTISVHVRGFLAATVALSSWEESKLRPIIQTYLDKWLPLLRPEGVKSIKFAVRYMKDSWSRASGSNRKMRFKADPHVP